MDQIGCTRAQDPRTAEDPGTQDCTCDEKNAWGDQTEGISIGGVAGFALTGQVFEWARRFVEGRKAHSARIMLNWLLAHKIAIGQVLSVVGATATVVIFENYFELAWYISVPVGVLAYVTMPILWTGLLDSLVLKIRH